MRRVRHGNVRRVRLPMPANRSAAGLLQRFLARLRKACRVRANRLPVSLPSHCVEDLDVQGFSSSWPTPSRRTPLPRLKGMTDEPSGTATAVAAVCGARRSCLHASQGCKWGQAWVSEFHRQKSAHSDRTWSHRAWGTYPVWDGRAGSSFHTLGRGSPRPPRASGLMEEDCKGGKHPVVNRVVHDYGMEGVYDAQEGQKTEAQQGKI